MQRLTPTSALAKLSEITGRQFMDVFQHGSLEIEIYKPVKVDLQKPHTRDEVYVVISGSGLFINREIRHPFQAGEVLFVAAGVEHRSRTSRKTLPRGYFSMFRKVVKRKNA